MRRNGLSNRRKVISGLPPIPSMIRRDGEKGEKTSSLLEPAVENILDLRGMIIPLTLLKIAQKFRKIRVGEIMEIIGSDPDTRREFLKILGICSCEVMCIRDEIDHYLIRLRKGGGKAGGGVGSGC